MKEILTPREFKLQNRDAYLEDYLKYLEGAQSEAEDTLNSAQALLPDNPIIEDIRKQAEEIYKMATIVQGYLEQIILKSVDTLTLEELQSYFNYDEDNKRSDDEKARLEDDKKALKTKLEEDKKGLKAKLEEDQKELRTQLEKVELQIENNLYLNGRIKEFYVINGVEEFFSDSEEPLEYLEKKLGDLLTPPSGTTTEELLDKLKRELTSTIETECKIQDIKLSSDETSELCDKIIALFKKCINILNHSKDVPTVIKQLSQVILSESGIKQFLSEAFDDDTATNIIVDLINIKKFDTEFYGNLPDDLQESLTKTRLQGAPYERLLRVYLAFLNNEDLPSDDLNIKEKEEKRQLEDELSELDRVYEENIGALDRKYEEEIERIDYRLASIRTARQVQKEFLSNEEHMRSVLKRKIEKMIDVNVTAETIDSIIAPEEERLKNLRADLRRASTLLPTLTKDLKDARAIFLSKDYASFFEAERFNSDRREYNLNGVAVTEEFISPFLEAEKKRQIQIDIMVSLQNKLSDIYNLIKEKKENTKLIPIVRYLPPYKKSLEALEEQYQNEVREAFENLRQQSLFQVHTPRISAASTVGNVIVLPPAVPQMEPGNFDEVSGLLQSFWDMSTTGVDENTKRVFLARCGGCDNWEDYSRELMRQQETLVNKLFSFSKKEGYYNFASSAEDCEQLKSVQTTIMEILSSTYEERKALREYFGESYLPLDPDKVSELEYFLESGANPSSANLAHYIEKTELEITKLKTLLANNSSLCIELGIALPEDVVAKDDTNKNAKEAVEEKIRNLGLDDVQTIEEATERRNFLRELEELTVPAPEVKQFYLKHKGTNS